MINKIFCKNITRFRKRFYCILLIIVLLLSIMPPVQANSIFSVIKKDILNPSISGFTVELGPPVPGLAKGDFTLTDGANAVTIESVITTDNGGIYSISAALEAGKTYTFNIIKAGFDFGVAANVVVPPGSLTISTVPSAGGEYSGYAIKSDGTVWGWGRNNYGQLGNNTTTDIYVPVQVSNLTNVKAISAGAYSGYSLKSDGTVWAWGSNFYGQLGNNSNVESHVPVQVSNLTGVAAIAGGYFSGYALKSDGTVWAWGCNDNGELGNDSTVKSNVPIQVSGLSGVISIAAGFHNGYAVKSDGTVWAWGNNGFGKLGNNSAIESHVPVQVYNLSGIKAAACGDYSGYALKSDGTVWAWGYNSGGRLGNSTTVDSPVPVQVSDLSGVTAIAAGSGDGYALKSDGTVWAWGYGGDGQIGNDSTTGSQVPVQVSGLSSVTAIAAGTGSSSGYALKSDGTFWAWGRNSYGQLGINSQTTSKVPVQIPGLVGGTDVVPAVPVSDFTCTNKTQTTADFSFTAPAGATAVKIQQSTDSGTTWTDSSSGPITAASTTATVFGLIPNTSYKFKLIVTGGSCAGESNIVDVTTKAAAIGESLTAGNPSTTGFTISLSPALAGLTSSDFILKDDQNNTVTISSATTSDNGSTYTISAALTAGKNYTVTAGKAGYDFGAIANLSIITITTSTLPAGTHGIPYNTILAAAGGTAPYTWNAAGLPAGLDINTVTGAIYGTPTIAGTSSIHLTVTDNVHASSSKDLSLTINPAVSDLTITNGSLPSGTVGMSYSTTLTATGGTAPYTWSASGLPAGLSLNASTGLISGIPTLACIATVTATVRDNTGNSISTGISLTINPNMTSNRPFAIGDTSPSVVIEGISGAGNGVVTFSHNKSYHTGATKTIVDYQWIFNVPDPQNINWNNYNWYGQNAIPAGHYSADGRAWHDSDPDAKPVFTFMYRGTYHAALRVVDNDTPAKTDVMVFDITVNPSLAINIDGLPSGNIGTSYSTTLAVYGGIGPYTWSASGLPAGLSISSGGVISGIPTTAGTSTVTITVHDNASHSFSGGYSLTVNPAYMVSAPVANAGGPYVLVVGEFGESWVLDGSGSYDPDEWAGDHIVSYEWDIDNDGLFDDASGEKPTFTYAQWNGMLAMGIIRPICLRVFDTTGRYDIARTTLTGIGTFTIINASLPAGTVGAPYNAALEVGGRIAPYTWSVSGLPAGLNLDASTGAISGMPTAPGTSTVTVTAADSAGHTTSKVFTLAVNPAMPVADPGGPYTIYIKSHIQPVDLLIVDSGEELSLDGSRSYDPDEASGYHIVSYEWDINGDGIYDVQGATPTLTWDELKNVLPNWPLPYPADPHTGLPEINIALKVTDNTGLTNINTTTLTIYDYYPVPVATWGPQPCIPIKPDGTATVHLDGSASYHGMPDHEIVNWQWSVKGSAQYATGETADLTVDLKSPPPASSLPSPIPPEGIKKTLCLTVTDDLGTSRTCEFDVAFKIMPSQPPYIRFNVDRGGIFIQQGENFTVSAAASSDPDMGDWINRLAWDINNDGTDDIIWNRADTNGDGQINISDAGPSYVLQKNWAEMAAFPPLQQPGTHLIRLTVTDNTGAAASDTVPLTVVQKAMIAKARALPTLGGMGTEFRFDGSESRHLFPGQTIINYQWDFDGDGNYEAAGQTCSHTFDALGVYPVTLKVRDAAGHEATSTVIVTVCVNDRNPPPVNHPPTAKNPVPVQSVVKYHTTSFTASDITQDADGDPLTIVGIITDPDLQNFVSVDLYNGTATLIGNAECNRVIIVRVIDGKSTEWVWVPITVTDNEPPLSITTSSLPAGMIGSPYNTTLSASGGTSPYSWSVTSLPAGLSLNTSTGVISGTPAAAGTSAVIVTVSDSSSPAHNTTASFSLTVNQAPVVTGDNNTAGTGIITPTRNLLPPVTDSNANASVTVTPRLDRSTGTAAAQVDSAKLTEAFDKAKVNERGVKTVGVEIPKVLGAKAYEPTLSASFLTARNATQSVEINTDIATVTLPGNMLQAANAAGAQNVSLTIASVDRSRLTAEVQTRLGGKPVIELGLKIDGNPVSWSNGNAPVTVSIPYVPTADESKHPEHITVWYIDGSGRIVSVPNGRYDPATGRVTFSTTHFSQYAVAYVQKTFSDISNYGWAKNQIEILASKGIISGTSENTFSPSASINRADYIVLLINTLGLAADFDSNFDDVQQGAYYYEATGIARKLGIAVGNGNNRFNPKENISRQDMMVLTVRALKKFKNLKSASGSAILEKFNDKGDIAGYAVESLVTLIKEGLITGSGDKLNPRAPTTRAESAVFLYNIYNKYL